jgi:predicted NBD/HSP70 family sugar kinase
MQLYQKSGGYKLKGIAVAMPGPFDYERGISLMRGGNKYEALYGLNIKEALPIGLGIPTSVPIVFENDAGCFGIGESMAEKDFEKIIAITLGTGFGTTFICNREILKHGHGVPPRGRVI